MMIKNFITAYLTFCAEQKRLSHLTLRAYAIDLRQFDEYLCGRVPCKEILAAYAMDLHRGSAPRTVKRKIASLKAFFTYLEYENFIEINPFSKLRLTFREPKMLPRTITIGNIQLILSAAYASAAAAMSASARLSTLRDVAVLELLFAAGVRVSELCLLTVQSLDVTTGSVRIFGKGAKERIVPLGNAAVLAALRRYDNLTERSGEFFFENRLGGRLSEQSVRSIIRKYASQAGITDKVTPHMYRHSFATMLLEEGVDIRYIQELLGHSSITTTQIYTHVSTTKQRSILSEKHPRNRIMV